MGKIKEIMFKIWNAIKKFFIKLKNIFSSLFKKIKEKQIHIKIKNGFVKLGGLIKRVFSKITKRNKDPKKEIEKARKLKENIEKDIDNETDITVIKMYKKQVIKTIKKVSKINNINDKEEIKNIKNTKNNLIKLQERIQKRYDKLNNKVSILDINKEEKEEINDEPIIEKEPIKEEKKSELPKKILNTIKNISIKIGSAIKKGSIKTFKFIGNICKKTGVFIAGSIGGIVSNINKKAKIKKLKKQEYRSLKNSVKEINLKINRAYKEISKVNNSYSDTKLQELLFIKEKVLDLKEDYIRLRGSKNFKSLKNDKNIYSVDPNHLVHHGNAIYDLIDYLELSINEVKEGRTTSEPKYPKEEPKEIIKEVKPKVITFEANDFTLVKECIEKDINSSLNEVVRIKNEMNDIPLKYKKSTVLSRTYTFFKYSMNTAISLIPFGIFKNKFVATLTSGIILNNRIKAMKSLIYDKRVEFIEYESIIEKIKDKNTCLENISFVLLDTVKQIDDVNSKLTEDYPNNQEALKLIKKLEEMKIDLLEENQKIEISLEPEKN